jgi:hypothetical protein
VVLLFTVVVDSDRRAFGMAPLLHLRERVVTLLKESGQRTTAGSACARPQRPGHAEVALAVVLVIGAGLLPEFLESRLSRCRIQSKPPGDVWHRAPGLRRTARRRAASISSRLTTELSAQSGVQGVAGMSGFLRCGRVNANDTDFEGACGALEGPFENVDYYQTATLIT